MSWIYLLCAGVFEIVWAVTMKHTDGFTQLWPSIGVASAMIISFILLACAIRHIPLGTAYAVWAGIGAAGAAICGVILYDEPTSLWRVLSLCAIVAGVLGLKLLHGQDVDVVNDHDATPPGDARKGG
jgi:quaternary ammonium compound-resistance protein SugE